MDRRTPLGAAILLPTCISKARPDFDKTYLLNRAMRWLRRSPRGRPQARSSATTAWPAAQRLGEPPLSSASASGSETKLKSMLNVVWLCGSRGAFHQQRARARETSGLFDERALWEPTQEARSRPGPARALSANEQSTPPPAPGTGLDGGEMQSMMTLQNSTVAHGATWELVPGHERGPS